LEFQSPSRRIFIGSHSLPPLWSPNRSFNPALPDDSSESYNYSPSRYDERDALRFKAERDETRRELEDVSKKAGIAELEWEHQRKQLLETIDGKSLD
jgi:hypothetical protein